jgi:DNA-binding response OmpR family regulator
MIITQAHTRVLVLEPNQQLRMAIHSLLAAEHYQVEHCDSLEQVLASNDEGVPTVALVAWQSMNGLLAEDQRHVLIQVASQLRLVVMVPRRWARLLDATDLRGTVAGLVAKPVDAEELLEQLRTALAAPVASDFASR